MENNNISFTSATIENYFEHIFNKSININQGEFNIRNTLFIFMDLIEVILFYYLKEN